MSSILQGLSTNRGLLRPSPLFNSVSGLKMKLGFPSYELRRFNETVQFSRCIIFEIVASSQRFSRKGAHLADFQLIALSGQLQLITRLRCRASLRPR